MSPDFIKVMSKTFQGDVDLKNHNYKAKKSTKSNSNSDETSETGSGSSDEDLEDYQKEGYHPMHVK